MSGEGPKSNVSPKKTLTMMNPALPHQRATKQAVASEVMTKKKMNKKDFGRLRMRRRNVSDSLQPSALRKSREKNGGAKAPRA